MICPTCKYEIVEDSNFCHNCGMAISQTAQNVKMLEQKNAQITILGKLVPMLKNTEDLLVVKNLINRLK